MEAKDVSSGGSSVCNILPISVGWGTAIVFWLTAREPSLFFCLYMRILGITIPDDKQLEIGLTQVYGVGRSRAQQVLDAAGVKYDTRPTDLTTTQENKIREHIESFTVEGELRRAVSANIKRLKDIKAYRGTRHARNLPARGQRTKTNSRTVRGNVRRTMGSGRRKVEKT